jgi:hypothetical protein
MKTLLNPHVDTHSPIERPPILSICLLSSFISEVRPCQMCTLTPAVPRLRNILSFALQWFFFQASDTASRFPLFRRTTTSHAIRPYLLSHLTYFTFWKPHEVTIRNRSVFASQCTACSSYPGILGMLHLEDRHSGDGSIHAGSTHPRTSV